MLNLTGATGRDALQTFTADNFSLSDNAAAVPEPPTLLLMDQASSPRRAAFGRRLPSRD